MFFVLKKKTIVIIGILLAVAILCACGIGVMVEERVFSKRLIPIYSVERDENTVALTFDCAWGAEKTRGIMDLIEGAGFKCTFFVTGFWVDANKEVVKEIVTRGHQIGNHSENHLHMAKLKENEVASEIDSVNNRIKELTGEETTIFRAPFGEYDNRLIMALNERKTACIQWSIDSLDWKGLSGGKIAERVTNKIRSGDIVLFHNNSEHILEGLPLVIETLKNKGLRAVRVDELIYKENFTINGEGKQIKNS